MHQTSTQSKMKASTIPMTCIWCHLAAGAGPWELSQKTTGTISASAVPTTNITAGWKNNYHHVICGDIRKNCYHCFICAAIWGWTAITPWSVVISGRAAITTSSASSGGGHQQVICCTASHPLAGVDDPSVYYIYGNESVGDTEAAVKSELSKE